MSDKTVTYKPMNASQRLNVTPQANRRWTGKTMGSRIGHWGFLVVLRVFGRRFAGFILLFVTMFYYLFIPKVRNDSRYYLNRRFSDCGTLRKWMHGWLLAYSFAGTLLDRLYLRLQGGKNFSVEFPDTQNIKNALLLKKGVIIVSAHIGNWEIAGRFFSRLGAPVSVVMFENERPEIKQLYEQYSREGTLPFEFIFSNDPLDTIFRIRTSLAKNSIIVMHGDRSMNGGGIDQMFLGKVAIFPDVPYRIAAATGTPIVCAFSLQRGMNRYRVNAQPHFLVENSKEGIKSACNKYVQILEDVVHRYPWQWYNFYDFWKR
jgi:predicted LPLAT superfamily acyltransferase